MPIVRRGAPFGRNIGPLQGMSFPTVEGRLKLGNYRGGRSGIGLLLPVDPTVPIPGRQKPAIHGVGVFTRGRGLGGISITGPGGSTTTSFKVGDPYTISITGGLPNHGTFLNATQCSPDYSRCTTPPMSGQTDVALSNWAGRTMTGNEPNGLGLTDASGNITFSGVFTPAQVGMWIQNWYVGGSSQMGIQFTVSDASGSANYTGPTVPGGTPYYQLLTSHPAAQQYTPAQLAAMAAVPSYVGQKTSGGGATLSFANLTSGNPAIFNVGDQYQISIAGATPGATVTASATKNGISPSTSTFGTTGADGSFITQGVITADSVGNWAETWNVGGKPVGSFSFSVAPGGGSNTGGGSGAGSGSGGGKTGGGSSGGGQAGGGSGGGMTLGGFDLSSIPTWGWIAAAGVGALLIFGGHRR